MTPVPVLPKGTRGIGALSPSRQCPCCFPSLSRPALLSPLCTRITHSPGRCAGIGDALYWDRATGSPNPSPATQIRA